MRTMLEQTFIHVSGIGYPTERRLWDQGALTWRSFLDEPEAFRVPKPRVRGLMETIGLSPEALDRGDYAFFAERLPARDHWRALHAFPGRVGYLDIETEGAVECD